MPLYTFCPYTCFCVVNKTLPHVLQLIELCGDVGVVTVPTDPSKLEEVFTQLLDVISARMKMLDLNLVFILIDNVDLLVVR